MTKVNVDPKTKETKVDYSKDEKEVETPSVVEYKDSLRIRQIYGGIPKTTSVPTAAVQEGELKLYDDGSSYRLYAYLNGAWRKLGDTDLGFTSRVRAYRGSAQSINANSTTKVQLDTEDYDGDGEFDKDVNYRFTAVSAGYYLVAAAASLDDLDDGERFQVMVYKGGGEENRTSVMSSAADEILRATISDVIYLDASGYLELYVRHNSGEGAKNLTGNSQQTFMAIHRLS